MFPEILYLMQVVLAANDLPSINDVTYFELIEIISKVMKVIFGNFGIVLFFVNSLHVGCQLKDKEGGLMGVDVSNLLIANSGNDLPVSDYV